MKINKDILDLINRFWGGFVVDISKEDIHPLIQEFVDKIKSLE